MSDSDSDDDILTEINEIIEEKIDKKNNESKTVQSIKIVNPKVVFDKYKGVIWGCAIADAIGLQFEGCDYRRAKVLAERGITFPKQVNQSMTDKIRGVFKGDWTDDTDHMVLLMDSAYFDDRNIMRIDNKIFASKLISWRHNGFPELGDTSGMGIGSLTAKLTSHPRYTIEPQIVAMETYKSLGGDINVGKIDAPAPNGALMRIAPLALSEDYLDEVLEHCIVTHYDARCIFTCVMQCDIIRYLIKNIDVKDTNFIQPFYEAATGILDPVFKDEVRSYHELGLLADIGNVNEFGLIETKIFNALEVGQYGNRRDKNGYTMVAYAIMLWALRAALQGFNYSIIIKSIIAAGGDADTNAAIAGAVLGAYFGYSKLPADWINATPHKDWLDKKIMNFLTRSK